jgi:hypothetical protein
VPEKIKPEPAWVSPEDACIIGGFGMTQCYEMMNDGTLVSKKLGNRRLIYVVSIHNAGALKRPNQTQVSNRPHLARRTRRAANNSPEAA